MASKLPELTEGPIISRLIKVAAPITLTSLIQMAYNLTDQFWLGQVNSRAIASAGAAGYFMWLGMTLAVMAKVGAEINIAHQAGRKDYRKALLFFRHGVALNIIIGLLYTAILLFYAPDLIKFILTDSSSKVYGDAVSYLRLVGIGVAFTFMTQTFTGLFTSLGKTGITFVISSTGLLVNMILDPLLIHGYGPFPQLGVKGAALATIIAQIIVFTVFIFTLKSKNRPLPTFENLKFSREYFARIIKLGFPVSIQNTLFCLITTSIGRIVFKLGSESALAAHQVGIQIESITWMTTHGLAASLTAFIGQNFGAQKWERIKSGYKAVMRTAVGVGLFSTTIFMLFSTQIFSCFNSEPQTLQYGSRYLFILGISQTFMCLEIISNGALNGIGRTTLSSISNTTFSALRIPLALFLANYPLFGVEGVWWAMTITSVIKGILMFAWFRWFLHRNTTILKK